MTNQEAIETIKLAQAQIEWEYPMDYAAAFDMAISALQAQELSETQNALDTISRQAAIDRIVWWFGILKQNPDILIDSIKTLPSAQPAPISEAYAKAVFTWLLDYQIKAAELKGRYTPYEVLSWVANDWRKEHE